MISTEFCFHLRLQYGSQSAGYRATHCAGPCGVGCPVESRTNLLYPSPLVKLPVSVKQK